MPKSYKTSSGFELRSWMDRRFLDYKKGLLSTEKMDALEAITGWVLDPEVDSYQEGLEHLKQYVREFRHARVPKKYKTSNGFKLGFWVFRKRWEYRKGILPDETIKAMEAINDSIWDPKEAYFHEAVKHLMKYINDNGHARVPHIYKTSCGFTLGYWVSERRAEFKIGVLAAEKVKELETITGWDWEPYKTEFQENLENLKQYVREHGHARVPRSYKTPSEATLGSWVNLQRRQYEKRALSAEKIKALEAIPGWIASCKKIGTPD